MTTFALHFARARAAGLRVTLHFGEAASTSSAEELRALLALAPDRLGHAVHVPPVIVTELDARRIPLELCLSCNVHAKMYCAPGCCGPSVAVEADRNGNGCDKAVSAGARSGSELEVRFADHHFGFWWKRRTCPVILCVSLSLNLSFDFI